MNDVGLTNGRSIDNSVISPNITTLTGGMLLASARPQLNSEFLRLKSLHANQIKSGNVIRISHRQPFHKRKSN